ncbi:frizzled-6 [Xiphophorus hellerii]|uniref:frizzled-6 n=1 Tax=Xiphophorus hellerii TaxID=8084 RepID=UPI0013B3A9AE|nr:frizzled-6 [Xiphophorus hellerii]XP_032413658.1 frizzled-6 [Xiphophorus hellerii]XP_032413659.1 frizzled-6 [Xiphophorus hellerii]
MLMPGPLWLWLSLAWVGSCGSHSLFTCEPIKVHRCLGMPYNMTFFPNMMDHYDQEIAASKMEPFMPLASLQCSPDVHHFLCQAFIPACSEENRVIRPCREKCEAVLSDCEENIRIFGIAWPPELQCNKLKPCGLDGSALPSTTPVTSSSLKRDLGFWCPLQLKTKPGHGSSFLGAQDCAPPCSNMYFRPHDIAFAKSFIGVCSIICLGATLFTFLTFLIDVKRFRYPERPIIFYAVCYSVVSLVYFLGFLIGNGAACTKADHHGAVETVVLGSHSKGCTLLFMLLYFFTMAGIVWWVILTITWFLAAGPKWSCEAIEKKAVWFHTAAWGIPGALTVMLLALNKVEGDNISGVCFVGLYDLDALRYFVLAPLCVGVVVGLFLILAGIVSLNHVRQVIQHDERNQEKLKKFMIRIGVFSCLYLVPLVTLLACYTYEQSHRGSWENTWINDRCQEYSIPCSYKASELTRPDLSLFLVKYLMTLVVGISAVFWVSSKKTCSEWAYFFKRNRKRDPISESRRVLQESCEFFLKHNSRVQHKKKHYKPTSHKLKVISKSMGTSTAVSPASTVHQGSSAFGNHELPMRSSLSETSAREHLDRGASGRSSRREREMEREGGERRSKGGSSSKVSSRSESMNRVADGRMTPRSELSDARQATSGQQQQQHPTLNQSHSSILDSAHQKVDKASEESKDPKEI